MPDEFVSPKSDTEAKYVKPKFRRKYSSLPGDKRLTGMPKRMRTKRAKIRV